jgi:hypothetical protein
LAVALLMRADASFPVLKCETFSEWVWWDYFRGHPSSGVWNTFRGGSCMILVLFSYLVGSKFFLLMLKLWTVCAWTVFWLYVGLPYQFDFDVKVNMNKRVCWWKDTHPIASYFRRRAVRGR